MMSRLSFLLFVVVFSMTISAQTRRVSGEYTYYGSPNQSLKEVKDAAIENARVQALAKEFGTLITQNTLQEEGKKGAEEHSHIMQISSAEVKGEWIEDLKKPEAKL